VQNDSIWHPFKSLLLKRTFSDDTEHVQFLFSTKCGIDDVKIVAMSATICWL